MNKSIMLGNLARDVELRYPHHGGTAIGSSSLAVNRKWKDQNGDPKEEVCFIDITFFGRSAEVANQYLKKGSKILVEGRLKQDTWTDNSGQKRSKHSIVVESMQMLDSKPEQNQSYNPQQQQPSGYTQTSSGRDIPVYNQNNDDIPF